MTSTLPRPGVTAPAAWLFPVPQQHQLANGLRVMTYDLPGRELATVRLVLDAPLAAEGRDGTASLAAKLWTAGTDEDDAETFARKVESVGATYHASALHAGPIASMTVPTRQLASALHLLAASVIRPAYADDEFARARHEQLDRIAANRARSENRGNMELCGLVFTPESRLSRPVDGSIDDVAALDVDAVRAYHSEQIVPSAATLLLIGDFSGTDVVAIVKEEFGDWSGSRPEQPESEAGAATARVAVVDRPGSVQTIVRIGAPSIDRHHSDWAALQIALYVVGGHMNSRLSTVLREEKGYTYGISCRLDPQRHGGLLLVDCSVATDVTGPALADIAEILRAAVSGGITPAERDLAADNFLLAGPIAYQTSDAIANRAVRLVTDGLTPDFINNWQESIRQVTAADASRALRDHLDLARLSLVLVGDAAAIEAAVCESWPGEPTIIPA